MLVAARAASLIAAGPARAQATPSTDRIAQLEADHKITIGLYARNLCTGHQLTHRPDTRFPICSVFKMIAAGAVLSGDLVVPDPHVLSRPVHLPPAALVDNSPFVLDCQQRGIIPTVEQLCTAALQLSDNTAGNALLSLIGGPTALTRFARGLGDPTTRLDRWEPELNSAEPGRVTDTTTPRAIGCICATLLTGNGLRHSARQRLTSWMLGNKTSDHRLRAALPNGWRVADKTGAGDFATANDVGIAWSPDQTPVVLSILTRSDDPAATRDDAVIAELGRICFADLG